MYTWRSQCIWLIRKKISVTKIYSPQEIPSEIGLSFFMKCSSSKTKKKEKKKTTLNTPTDSLKAKLFIWQFQRTTLGIIFYFLVIIICTETFTRTSHYNMSSPKVFLFEFENEVMGPLKRFFLYIVARYS